MTKLAENLSNLIWSRWTIGLVATPNIIELLLLYKKIKLSMIKIKNWKI